MPGQLGEVGIDDLVFGAVCVGAADVKPGPIADRLDHPDVVPAVIVAALALRDAVGHVGGLHVDRVPLAVGGTQDGCRRNAKQAIHSPDV